MPVAGTEQTGDGPHRCITQRIDGLTSDEIGLGRTAKRMTEQLCGTAYSPREQDLSRHRLGETKQTEKARANQFASFVLNDMHRHFRRMPFLHSLPCRHHRHLHLLPDLLLQHCLLYHHSEAYHVRY